MKLSNLMRPRAARRVAAHAQVFPYENLMPEFTGSRGTPRSRPAGTRRSFVRASRQASDFLQRADCSATRDSTPARQTAVRSARAPKISGRAPIALDDCARHRPQHHCRLRGSKRLSAGIAEYRCETPISFGLSLYQFRRQPGIRCAWQARIALRRRMIALLHPQRRIACVLSSRVVS
jgi:hypothetical protein